MQFKRFHRFLSTCCFTLAVLGSSLMQAAEFKPFATLQFAGPSTLISIAEKVATLVEVPEFTASIAMAAPYKNLPGVNAAGNIGLAIAATDSPIGVDAIVSLPISDFGAFTIPGFEEEIDGFRAALVREGNKYTLVSPFGSVMAYQQSGFLIVATEGVAEFAATANPKNLFAEVDEFTLGLHVNLENVTEQQMAKIWGPIAFMLAMQGMDVPDPADLTEVVGPVAEQIKDWATFTTGLTLDPRTLNLTGTTKLLAKAGTELADKFAKSKEGLAKTKMGSFLPEKPQTIFAWHYLNYCTDSEIKTLKETLNLVSQGLLEGLSDSMESGADDEKQLGKVIKAAESFLEYLDGILDFFAKERLIDCAYSLDTDGSLIMAMATDKTAEAVALDEKFYNSLLTIFEEDGIKALIEGKMKQNYETVAGYSLSCIPNLFSDLPAGIDIPDEAKALLANIPLCLIWSVKEGEALVYAVGLDFAKTEQTLKAVLAKPLTQAPPKQSGVFALKPFADFFLNTIVPLIPEMSASDIEMVHTTLLPFSNASANAKIVYTEEYPGATYLQKVQVNGEIIAAYIEMLKPAIGAARGAARRMQCTNNLKMLVLALHNYHDTQNAFPPLYSVDASGKALHSWRVHILPFIEEMALYGAIRFDEPWDSPHNKQFHAMMPAVFKCPDNPEEGCTYSVIAGQVFVPATAATPGGRMPKGNSIAMIQDGTSNTFAIVEVKQPFNWMDPTADITLDELAKGVNTPNGKVGGSHTGGCNVGFFDGSVRFVTDAVSSEILRAFGDPKDGKAVLLP